MKKDFFCPICNNKSYNQEKQYKTKTNLPTFQHKQLVRCIECGSYSIYPVPSTEELSYYYKLYWKNESFEALKLVFKAQAEARQKYLKKYYIQKNINRVIKILDVGAGYGSIGLNLRKKFKPHLVEYNALEIDPKAVKFLQKNLKPRRIFNNVTFIKGKYDLIILSHILEHIENPLYYLMTIKSKLTKGGILFIEIPNQDYLFKTTNEPHLIFFDTNAISYLLNRAGFKILRLDTCGNKITDLKHLFDSANKEKLENQKNHLFYGIIYRLSQILKIIKNPEKNKNDNFFQSIGRSVSIYGPDRHWIRLLAKIN